MAAGSVAAITGVAVIASAAPRAPACLMNFERFIEKKSSSRINFKFIITKKNRQRLLIFCVF